MKKWGLVFLGLCIACNSFAGLAPWNGQPNTTYQSWGFGTDAPVSAPDSAPALNPYGDPTASILHTDGTVVSGDDSDTRWMSTHPQFGTDLHSGVWRFYGSDYLELIIPNDPEERPIKEIYLQLTYSASNYPIFKTTPGFLGIELISDIEIDSNYDLLTLLITIEPNPSSETIELRPNDCTMYIDQIIVDTICVPEPATMVLLSLGGLLLRKRRA
jgi:hypothetical protein